MSPSASLTGVTPRPGHHADERVILVLRELGWDEAALELVQSTWLARRTPGEPLAQFLVRCEVLQPAAPLMLAHNWGDQLLSHGAADLVRPDALARLRQFQHRPLCVPRTVPDTVPAEDRSSTETRTTMSHQETPVLRRPLLVPGGDPSRLHSSATPLPPANSGTPCPDGAEVLAEMKCGQVIGRCLITGKISEGSYGVVYRAMHRTLNIPVAVKVLHADFVDGDTPAHQQFRTEAMLLARLTHPNIVRLWDFDDTVRPPYLVLEFIEGHSVADLIQKRGLLPPDLSRKIILQIADGLAVAHQVGIVHRDLKPANILVTRDARAKIADLGLAVLADPGRPVGHLPIMAATALAGTVAYLAPEQAGGSGAIDHRSDIYSLGATLYHMVTGQLPFCGKSAIEVLMKHARDEVIPPHELVPEVSPAFSQIILKMLAKQPAARYGSYDDLQAALILCDPIRRPAKA